MVRGISFLALALAVLMIGFFSYTAFGSEQVSDETIAGQRQALAEATEQQGFGPQAPRDIEAIAGVNANEFAASPDYAEMHLCNIHFHESAEHKGGQYTTYAGNGDGKGYGTGFVFDGQLSDAEVASVDAEIGASEHGDLEPGDTIEVHFVHTTAMITPGPSLASCLSENIANPQLRVEAVIMVLVNDPEAADFGELAETGRVNGYHQALNIPNDLGLPVTYAGSTTGPSFNEVGSPLQVWWSVRPKVIKVDINSVATWLGDNEFDEKYAHGVRNLVINPELLSEIVVGAN